MTSARKLRPNAQTGQTVANRLRYAQSMQHVIVLGAGASKVDGAPLQFDLLREYFLSEKSSLETPMKAELQSFFQAFYGIDTGLVDGNTEFPTFEEVLGTLELALARNENFRVSEQAAHDWDQRRIQECRSHVVALICSILARKLGSGPGSSGVWHDRLVQNIPRTESNTSFISFNYDLLIDNALAAGNYTVDYGTVFANPIQEIGARIGLYKLHGSLNWLRCPICGALTNTGDIKGASYPTEQRPRCRTVNCNAATTPIVIPPTFFKVMSDFHLQQVWHVTEQTIAAADRIYFCGYSLPDADMHIRYLLKRAEVNRGRTPEVFVITNHSTKTDADRDSEKKRYRRLYRDPSKVVYTSWGFEDFAKELFAIGAKPRTEIEWTPGSKP
jgi:hypothetical protein